ncbi:hypothetical protein [Streptomyces hainanensis]|uniref:WD40 repeat domain-containing protein n=1 Tax=Streptomyces hainanensis TaxID=402648 RepID=A0A4R4TVS9_9ACTN|nr:hypothetical protein [Streptomyces hainanensis]TDC79712.1 hypothetical protein E1283_02190 [Streptomyces hainanensis]
MERVAWADARRIDRQVVRYLDGGHVEPLHRLIRSVPLADGVRLARRLPAPPPDGSALAVLAAADELTVRDAADAAARAVRTDHELRARDAHWLSFGVGDPVLTVTTRERPDLTRITMLDGGTWHDVYRGTLKHHAVGCVDAENVVAVRDDPARGLALVHYAAGTERLVMAGQVLLGTRPAGTAAGFVAGGALTPTVAVAGPDRQPDIMDLARFGLETAAQLAVDPTGQAVAFGDGTAVVVTDARMEHLVARNVVPSPYAPVRGLTFTDPHTLVVGGANGGLSRWRISPHEALALEAIAEAPTLSGLFAIPAWGVIGGRAGGEHQYFDPDTLAPVTAPRPLLDAGWDPRLIHTVAGSADGRFAVVDGHLDPGPDGAPAPAMAHYDFHHPLARLLRPVGSLDASDLTALADAAADPGTPHRETLALLHAVATAGR